MFRETLKEQIYFQEHDGEYRANSSQDITYVYHDDVYMARYMNGLALSTFLWPQHRRLYVFFKEFIDSLKKMQGGCYMEIGAGHGLYARYALSKGIFGSADFVDVSETGLAMTKALLEAKDDGAHKRYFRLDFSEFVGDGYYDVISACEVIEAVDHPKNFIRKCHDLLERGGFLHISTPINAPMADCVYLFESPAEVEQMLEDVGFQIRERTYVIENEIGINAALERKMPVNVAYIAIKR